MMNAFAHLPPALRQHRRRLSELTLLAALLVALSATCIGLIYQAIAASRSNVETANSALRQYAKIAAWQFATLANARLQRVADDMKPSNRAAMIDRVPALADSLFAPIMRRGVLLPQALLSAAAQQQCMRLEVSVGGKMVYASGPASVAVNLAVDSMTAIYPHAVVRVGIADDAASQLLIGGVPHSRLTPILLLGLVAVSLLVIAIRQMLKSVELSRLRSDIVASASHELRTPLALMRVYTELLIDEDPKDRDERMRFLSVVAKEIRRLTGLVDNLLRFAELGRGVTRIAPVPVDAVELIVASVADFHPLATAHHVGLSVVSELDHPVIARVDHEAVRQILFNLLMNAVKFAPENSSVRVILNARAGSLHVAVEDQGPGIPIDKREAVFGRHVRLAPLDHGRQAGSGIGLAIVRELCSAQEISVSIEAAPAGGTRVCLEIPVLSETLMPAPVLVAVAQ